MASVAPPVSKILAPPMAQALAPATSAAPGGAAGAGGKGDAKPAKVGADGKPIKKKVRRKKPPGTPSTKTSTQASVSIYSSSRSAQQELASQVALAAARKSDPLWYRTEEAMAAVSGDSVMAPGILADQVEIVEAALNHNHLTRADVTPQAYACLLEQARRHALELLADAQDYAYSANRQEVTRADILLAAELRPDQPSFATHTQHHKMVVVSHQVNRKPLPPIPTHCYSGIVLPPKEHQLTARTFDVVTGAQVQQRMVSRLPKLATPTTAAGGPSYGASRGRQIPISLMKREDVATPMDTTTSTTGAAVPVKRKADQM
jgi:histone H3/H4